MYCSNRLLGFFHRRLLRRRLLGLLRPFDIIIIIVLLSLPLIIGRAVISYIPLLYECNEYNQYRHQQWAHFEAMEPVESVEAMGSIRPRVNMPIQGWSEGREAMVDVERRREAFTTVDIEELK
jgi:hypothetical protein